jgi:hypothetical protein
MCSKDNTIYFSWQLFIVGCSLVNTLLWWNCLFINLDMSFICWCSLKNPCIGDFFCFILFQRIFIVKNIPCPPYMFMHLLTSNPYTIKPFILTLHFLYIYLTISFTYYQLTCKYCVHIPIVATFFFVLITNEKRLCHCLHLFKDQNISLIFQCKQYFLGNNITNVMQN